MKHNEILRQQIFEIIANQMRDNKPKETNITYRRLVSMGYTDEDAKMYIGQCVAVEIFNIMKYQQKFDEKRYIGNLKNLPKEPFE
jgi:hypothetical protein